MSPKIENGWNLLVSLSTMKYTYLVSEHILYFIERLHL